MRASSRGSKSGIGESIRALLAEAKAVAEESNSGKVKSVLQEKNYNDRLGLSIVQNNKKNNFKSNESVSNIDRLGLKNISRIQHKDHLKKKININKLSDTDRERLISDAVSEIVRDSLKHWIKNSMPMHTRKTVRNILGVATNKET